MAGEWGERIFGWMDFWIHKLDFCDVRAMNVEIGRMNIEHRTLNSELRMRGPWNLGLFFVEVSYAAGINHCGYKIIPGHEMGSFGNFSYPTASRSMFEFFLVMGAPPLV